MSVYFKKLENFDTLYTTDKDNAAGFDKPFSFGVWSLENPENHIEVFVFANMYRHTKDESKAKTEIVLNVFGEYTSDEAENFFIHYDRNTVVVEENRDEDVNLIQRRFLLDADLGKIQIGLKNDKNTTKQITWEKLEQEHVVLLAHDHGSVVIDLSHGVVSQDVERRVSELLALIERTPLMPQSLVEHIHKRIAKMRQTKQVAIQ